MEWGGGGSKLVQTVNQRDSSSQAPHGNTCLIFDKKETPFSDLLPSDLLISGNVFAVRSADYWFYSSSSTFNEDLEERVVHRTRRWEEKHRRRQGYEKAPGERPRELRAESELTLNSLMWGDKAGLRSGLYTTHIRGMHADTECMLFSEMEVT